METKTLNQWMRELGYKWAEGREEMLKSHISRTEAVDLIQSFMLAGSVKPSWVEN